MAEKPNLLGDSIYIFENVQLHPSAIVGHGTVIGYPSIDLPYPPDNVYATIIEENVRIGCFCVIEAGAHLKSNVKLDHYVRVGPGSIIGEDTYLLYGTRIHCDVKIGKRCRISGNCPDRTIIFDNVRHFGRLHHNYSSPFKDWDEIEEPSPTIGPNSVIGSGAVIIGGVKIGHNVYIAAGEIVKTDVPDCTVVYKNMLISGAKWRGELKETGFFEYEGGQNL